MDKLLTQLVGKLQKAYGERLISVVLYGSAVTGDHQADFSDINILCVLSEVSPRELAAGGEIFRWWREQGSPSPLLLTEQELVTSADCFAIEFHDIQRQHRLLHGKDVITPLRIEDTFYRAQVEHELRAKLLRVRQKAARHAVQSRSAAPHAARFGVHLLRALPPRARPQRRRRRTVLKRDVIRRASEAFGIDGTPFERLLDVREGSLKPRDLDPVQLLASYLKEISQVIDAVDRIERIGELS